MLRQFSDKRIWLSIPLGAAAAIALTQFINIIGLLHLFPGYVQDVQPKMFMLPLESGIALYGVITPVIEETIFRWAFFGRLKKYMATAAAAIGSSLIFGIYHGNIIQFIYASLFGLILCFVYWRFNGVAASVFTHSAANIVSYVTALVPFFSFLGTIWGQVISCIICFALMFFIIRYMYETSPMDRSEVKKYIFPQK